MKENLLPQENLLKTHQTRLRLSLRS